MAESVKVAVRVRPFNNREIERSAKCIIKMVGNSTTIQDPEDPSSDPRKFTFDFSYWSHDSFDTKPDGVMVPSGGDSNYADQQMVFNDLGLGVLANAFAGFNTSLFAYGQTGSGKSYSMVGYGNNKGIVPLACDHLFSKIEENKARAGGPTVRYQVTFSMLEIYNEQVRDLLAKDQAMKGGLPVRQNTQLGRFYVQGLSKVPVFSYAEIERRINEGTSNRTLAATKMNATSSRAHTVVTILFEQISKNDEGKETTKSSEINLVDLAGSERADSTGATGDTLKEGSMINKSLSCLGNVISALAELSTSKKKIVVPYRDSVLTKLLQNSLGGNSKTIMIAALSPADINYAETLSTLRYADRAKQIKNMAIVNESATDKLIRSLKEENERLKKMLEGGGVVEMKAGMNEDDVVEMRRQMEEEIRAQLEENNRAIKVDEGGWEEVREQMQRGDEKQKKEDLLRKQKIASVPHIVNLNEDPLLSNVVFHFLEKPVVVIGKTDDQSAPDVMLSGLSIRKEHAIISGGPAGFTIKPGNTIAKTKLNGAPLAGEVQLNHLDRILFGSNHMYVFVNPKAPTPLPGTPEHVTWDFAQNEIAKAKGFHTDHNGLTQDQLRTQEQVLELLPLLSEANAVCEEMNKSRTFEVALLSGIARGERGKDASTQVLVKMRNTLNGNEWLWLREKFLDKRFVFQSYYQEWCESDYSDKFTQPVVPGDPFYEPVESILIGTANAFLQSLSYALDFQDTLTIVDYKGEDQGRVRLTVTPCTETGAPLDDDHIVDEPAELLGKPFHYKVTVVSVDINKVRFSKGICCKYTIFGQKFVETPVVRGLNVIFNHTTQFDYPKVSADLLEWLESGCLSLHFYATQDEADDPALAATARRFSRQLGESSADSQLAPLASLRSAGKAPSRLMSEPASPSAVSEPRSPAFAPAAPSAAQAELENSLRAKVAALEQQLDAAHKAAQEDAQRSPPEVDLNKGMAQAMSPQGDISAARIAELERDLQHANLKFTSREKKLQQVVDAWKAKPAEEQVYADLMAAFSEAVKAGSKIKRFPSNMVPASRLSTLSLVPLATTHDVSSMPAQPPAKDALKANNASKTCVIQ